MYVVSTRDIDAKASINLQVTDSRENCGICGYRVMERQLV
jgi:hypothetical protein